MTEAAVREVFFKNYSGRDLNEALRVSMEEIMLGIIKEDVGQPESLPEIVETIVLAKSRITLFGRMTAGTNFSVPVSYLVYFDTIRKAMIDVVRYTRDNLEIMSPWFREHFTKEDLKSIASSMASSIEKAAERPANVRAFRSGELRLYDEFFNSALIGIVGVERFKKYAQEYNKHVNILNRCQIECQPFENNIGTKES
ncbi:MAG: hypothetical protein A3I26_03585 [Candidatus Yanofskybacteria bacterium RIFCSPLOWO2_02_FULL_43_10]|uniref:Uncharacterized protein n=1 Tax=Candidatus Yanofskybacteria bacterium RIFCSPLOWO2_12_FULL_43_11b TaxID=1802710 RepID=A0A1F8H6L9_9BACT|nr:MAG: hypothetical protein A2742_01380 [Candidatus Yanofskybacteria bacterium RIFCSPHIGHO2_01_FULL_43_32]OGN11989.1 MAG: hypothetical protein A3C69_02910 [Candidatus Yanofskybacteria bacterium RIFCSPHIGHO2_02_FULL_43_12]OGN17816.1 MAG: hypothetical protein A3E34_01115 [Candidatus Yanofskybacteria bacterium RIFCSPHIGHO2_12_FULL_43_11]OGN24774.1 MAG: hypothetical protein A2923_03070 [Candidatus Yanofskybacteria bacterium RIFCSPLOWO2_01_FULL_43_46]OGN30300.1 MAG: hypothetical protein A3I26_03585